MATAPSYAVGRSTLGEKVSSNQEVETFPFPPATNDQRRNNSNGMVKYGRNGRRRYFMGHTYNKERKSLWHRDVCASESCSRIPVHKPMVE